MRFKLDRSHAPLLIALAFASARLWLGLVSAAAPTAWNFGDVDQWMDVGDRVLAGQVPFRDFTSLYGPLLYYWMTLWYKVCGADWHAAFLQLEVISPLFSWALAYLTAARLLRGPLFQTLFLACVGLFGLDRFFWTPGERLWLGLAALAWAWRALEQNRAKSFGLACFVSGLCLLVSFEAGCAAIVACAVLAVASFRLKSANPWGFALAWLACFTAIALLGLITPSIAKGYLQAVRGMAGITNWYGGLPFPAFGLSVKPLAFWLPLFCVAGIGGWSLLGCATRKTDANAFIGLGLAVFCAFTLRGLLGRSDYHHLSFALAPVLLLWVRSCESVWEASQASPRRSRVLVLCCALLLPYAVLSIREPGGALAGYWQALTRAPRDLVFWPEEGLSGEAAFVDRMKAVTAAVKERLGPGEKMLSLPSALYHHLARSPSAMPFNHTDHLLLLPDGPQRAIAALESNKVSVVVVDPAFLLPYPRDHLIGYVRPDPLEGRLTWAAQPDEAITRELREYLLTHFQKVQEVQGAVIYSRKPAPKAPWKEHVVEHYALAMPLSDDQDQVFSVPSIRCDEVRIRLSAAYPLGTASLAKTFARISIRFKSGDVLEGYLPVPPARVGKDIRVPVPSVPISELAVRVAALGSFNPAPKKAVLESIDFISRK
ncbi:MAG: hypothetical protein WC943_03755 [Elusimicrobiota bacterium]|jgi:hypothetical protein